MTVCFNHYTDLEICQGTNCNPYRIEIPEVLFLLITLALQRNLSTNDRFATLGPWEQELAPLVPCPPSAAGPKTLLVWIS